MVGCAEMVVRWEQWFVAGITAPVSNEDLRAAEFRPGGKVPQSLLKAMADTILHRGPDDHGYYISRQIGLGFRRLSIIDLAGGH